MSSAGLKSFVVAMLAMLIGCSASGEPTRIEVGGSPGSRVTGYYILNGRRVDLDTALPTTLPAYGVSQLAVRKVNSGDELRISVRGTEGMMSSASPPGQRGGFRVQVAGGISVSRIDDVESLTANHNAIGVISPYWYQGTWVFDDAPAGLRREPFVGGVPEMIDYLVRDIPTARGGFRLTFSPTPFPGFQQELTWVRAEFGGNRYRLAKPSMEGWLCPAMFRYFDRAPERLYVRADPREAPANGDGTIAR